MRTKFRFGYGIKWTWKHFGFIRYSAGLLKRTEKIACGKNIDGSPIYNDQTTYEQRIDRVSPIAWLRQFFN